MTTNIRKNSTQCEIILSKPQDALHIGYFDVLCRVIGNDNYIKAECFGANGNKKFRVRIEIESIPDNEQSDPQQKILPFEIKASEDYSQKEIEKIEFKKSIDATIENKIAALWQT